MKASKKKSISKKIIPAITEIPPKVNATGYPIRINTKTKANNNKGMYSIIAIFYLIAKYILLFLNNLEGKTK